MRAPRKTLGERRKDMRDIRHVVRGELTRAQEEGAAKKKPHPLEGKAKLESYVRAHAPDMDVRWMGHDEWIPHTLSGWIGKKPLVHWVLVRVDDKGEHWYQAECVHEVRGPLERDPRLNVIEPKAMPDCPVCLHTAAKWSKKRDKASKSKGTTTWFMRFVFRAKAIRWRKEFTIALVVLVLGGSSAPWWWKFVWPM